MVPTLPEHPVQHMDVIRAEQRVPDPKLILRIRRARDPPLTQVDPARKVLPRLTRTVKTPSEAAARLPEEAPCPLRRT